MAKLSPMMQQYMQLKEQYRDTILFFRLGDFYEMFFNDAKLVSKELELTLTGRECGQNERAPMCGVPYHSSEAYIARLVKKGYKVAICEQLEEVGASKGPVKRDVVRVITPGTVLEGSMLDEARNNFICCIFFRKDRAGVCFCDISTGELYATELVADDDDDLQQKIKNELGRFNPKEIVLAGEETLFSKTAEFIKERLLGSVETLAAGDFDPARAESTLLSHFKKENLSELELGESPAAVSSVGALMTYLSSTQKTGLERINTIKVYAQSQFMRLDFNTIRNLELLQTMLSKEKKGSLLWVLDHTKTAMGKRLLRIWIEQPLLSLKGILARQDAVQELYVNLMVRSCIEDSLVGIHDIERLMTRIVYGSANAKDLRALSSALEKLPSLRGILGDVKSGLLKQIAAQIDPLDDVLKLIDDAIVMNPPFSVREGEMIKPGYSKEIDLLKSSMTNGTGFLAEIEAQERERTGIPKLKVAFNRVMGYYIEVTNTYKHKVPDDYIRKQTLSNCERYITRELKILEDRILGAKEKIVQLEYQLFNEVREKVAAELVRVQNTAKAIAALDVLVSFAGVASKNNYCRPSINDGGKISIKEGRHPVVEALLTDSPFVPNDVLLDKDTQRVSIITGPNMAGKSTYMRQVALIVLMAQIGSFVPASSAEIGIVDSIFTRVGASDDLASGQSTFMVEMTEVAQIIKNATSDSLLILDEIGRGTSTFDGMSIARAVLEYVADPKTLGAKTLFATHYHELTILEALVDGVKNYNIAVKKRGDDITFLRRIVPGGADDSFGIEVSKLAGIPEVIVKRAKEILKELECNNSKDAQEVAVREIATKAPAPGSELTESERTILAEIKALDVNTLTPIEAMNKLFALASLMKDS